MISAEVARRESQQNLKSVAIEPYLNNIQVNVEKAIKDGQFSINYFEHIPIDYEQAVFTALRQLGYTVEHIPDPDPGHPCSRSYTRIKW